MRTLTATALSLALCAVAASAAARPQEHAGPASIVGVWTLNKDASDPPRERADGDERGRGSDHAGRGRGYGGGFGRGGGRGGGGGAPGGGARDFEERRRRIDALHDIMDAPERLTIAQTESLIIITTGDGRTTRLSPDGKKIKDESTGFERKTRREGGHVISEITGGPSKIIETYAIDPEHHRLTVTVQVDNPKLPNGGVTHRVYDADHTHGPPSGGPCDVCARAGKWSPGGNE